MKYSENPHLDLNTVTTVNGETEYRINCRKIKNKYYIKDKDVFFIKDTWYVLANGKIVFDHEQQKMVIKSETPGLMHGVVDFDKKGNPIQGLFTPNIYNNVDLLTNDGGMRCMSADLAVKNGYVYNGKCMFSKGKTPQIKNNIDYRRNSYNIDDDPNQFKNLKDIYGAYKLPVKKELVHLSKYLDGKTFGCELECISGSISDHLRFRHGVMICRDGSLVDESGVQGPEYVTVPMEGAKGIQNLLTLSKELIPTNRINYNCALHIHMGNIRTDRVFLVALYKLGVAIQNDLFKMFPFYKNDEIKYAGKQKNYCKKLKNYLPDFTDSSKDDYKKYITSSYNTLFAWLLGSPGTVPDFNINRKNRRHPKTNKWERNSRYYWLNFMNMFFSDRDTMEFRLHTPTLNGQKIVNWLFIINAIMLYAENNSEEIIRGKKVSITDILNIYSEVHSKDNIAKELSEYLLAYYRTRSKVFSDEKAAGIYVSPKELEEDATYFFDHPFAKKYLL